MDGRRPPPPPMFHGGQGPAEGIVMVEELEGREQAPPRRRMAPPNFVNHEMPQAPFPPPQFMRQQSKPNVIVNNFTRISDISPVPVKDEDFYRKALTTYEVYTLNKDDSGAKSINDKNKTKNKNKNKKDDKQKESSWARVSVSRLTYSHDAVVKKIKALNEGRKKVTDIVNKLYPHQQRQVSSLLETSNSEEIDPRNFEWTVEQLEKNIVVDKKSGTRQTATMTIYLKRAPRPEANATMLYKRSRNQANRPQQFEADHIVGEPVFDEGQQRQQRMQGGMRGGMRGGMQGGMQGGMRRNRAPEMQAADPGIVVIEDHGDAPGRMPRPGSRPRFDETQREPSRLRSRPPFDRPQRQPSLIRRRQSPPTRQRPSHSPHRQRNAASRDRRRQSPGSDSGSSSGSESDSGSSRSGSVYSDDTRPSTPESAHRGRRPKQYQRPGPPTRQHSRTGDQLIIENGRGNRRATSRYPVPDAPSQGAHPRPGEHIRSESRTDTAILQEIFLAGTQAAARAAEQISIPASPRALSSIDDHDNDASFRHRGPMRGSIVDDPYMRSVPRGDESVFRRHDEPIHRLAPPRVEEDFDRLSLHETSRVGLEDPYLFRRRSNLVPLQPLPLDSNRSFDYTRNPFAPRRQPKVYQQQRRWRPEPPYIDEMW